MSTATPPATDVRLVVGYDGSPPANRVLDAAVRLLQGRTGGIDVVYVAHISSLGAAHPGATVVIVVASSSQVTHRVVGSVAVGLARHSPVPLVVVP